MGGPSQEEMAQPSVPKPFLLCTPLSTSQEREARAQAPGEGNNLHEPADGCCHPASLLGPVGVHGGAPGTEHTCKGPRQLPDLCARAAHWLFIQELFPVVRAALSCALQPWLLGRVIPFVSFPFFFSRSDLKQRSG